MKFLLITLFSFCTISCASAQDGINLKFSNSDRSIGGQCVEAPFIPDSISFAGEMVPLNDEDVRIALSNEILITKYMHSKTMRSLLDSRRYFAVIEPILKENGIPDDFKYLAVAESSLDPNAYSYAKAAGLWQILAATGTQYKLEVGSTVDERYHVEKSTIAACKYLTTAYNKFGSWTMAAASYNVGMAGLARRAESQKESKFFDLILPTETMRYVFRILTYKILCEYPENLGYYVGDDDYYPPFRYREITVKTSSINWVNLAKEHGTTYKKLKTLNPWIREYTHSNKYGKSYTVRVPIAYGSVLD
ncbi:MAG: lytic transglycosylase domain-containing protein [Rikenellaceae bacterium]